MAVQTSFKKIKQFRKKNNNNRNNRKLKAKGNITATTEHHPWNR